MLTVDQINTIDALFPVLKSLPEQDRCQLFTNGQVVLLPEGQMLMQQNQQCQFIPLVLSGSLRIFKLSPNGREMTLYRIGAGDTCLVSIACQIRGEDFPALAQAEEQVKLLMLPVALYHDVMDSSIAWKDFLISSIYGHMTGIMDTLEAVAFDRMDYRLVHWLLDKVGHQAGTVHATHEAIAVELGTAREVISRLLGELKAKGVVTLGREKIEIKNVEQLQNVLKSS